MIPLIIWDELGALWDEGDFRGVHDWLNERWARVVQTSVSGERDAFAAFLQSVAFAALAFHFADEQNGESTAIFLDDAMVALPRFLPTYAGIEVEPILASLYALRARIPAEGEPWPPAGREPPRPLRFSARVSA